MGENFYDLANILRGNLFGLRENCTPHASIYCMHFVFVIHEGVPLWF